MLHQLDTNSTAISYWQAYEYVYTNTFSFGKRILPGSDTCEVGSSNSMAQPMK